MKRVASSGWYVGEPSAIEYGHALSEAAGRLNSRYSPLEVKLAYFNSMSTASTGYLITLESTANRDYNIYQWYLAKSSYEDMKLYGPAVNEEIDKTNFRSFSIEGQFPTVESAMSYLFDEYSDVISE